jgi:hypothetical protein
MKRRLDKWERLLIWIGFRCPTSLTLIGFSHAPFVVPTNCLIYPSKRLVGVGGGNGSIAHFVVSTAMECAIGKRRGLELRPRLSRSANLIVRQ